MNIFIAEDDVFISEELKAILLDLGYAVTGIGHNFESSVRLLNQAPPDLAILDIKMHGTDQGFRIASYINENLHIPYIFLTSFSDKETVRTAVQLKPAAYLVKPFTGQDIFTTLETVKNNFYRNAAKIPIRDGHATVFVDFSEVLWIKADDKYVEIQTSSKKYVQRGTLSALLEQWKNIPFERVHRSFAVNTARIEKITRDCIVIGNTEIPVSRTYLEKIRKSLEGNGGTK